MPTVLELSAPYGNYLLPVRPAGPHVCFVCGTSVAGTYPMCYQCSQAAQLLPACADAVAAIALSVKGRQYAHELWAYKNAPSEETRAVLQLRLCALLWRWVQGHEACLARRAGVPGFDRVAVVPSTSGRTYAPLGQMVGQVVSPLVDRYSELLTYNDEAPADRSFDAQKFRPRMRLDGDSVLLIDDTWTTGGHAQSAAAVLRGAGAAAVGVLVLGRHFTTQQAGVYGEAAIAYLAASVGDTWDFDTCMLHDAPPA